MAVEDVIARLVVQGQAQFAAQMSGAGKQATAAGDATATAGKKAGMSAKGLLQAAAAAGLAYKAYGFLKSSVSATVDLAKATSGFARSSGLDKRTSQAWVTVAKSRGIQTKQLQMSMTSLGRGLTSAAGGSKATASAFASLGLDAKNLIALDPSTRLGMIADSFKAIPDGAQKAALAQKLFGRAGQALLPILNSGAKGIHDQIGEANKLVPYNAKAAKSALELAKQQREMGMAMTGIKTAIGGALIPILSALAKAVMPVLTAFTQLMSTSTAFRVVIYALTAGIIALTVAMMANPAGLIVAGIIALAAAFALAYQKVAWFRNGVDAVGNALGVAFRAVVTAVGAAVDFISAHWKTIGAILLLPLAPIAVLVGAFIHFRGTISNVISGAISTIGRLPGAVKNAATSAISGLASVLSGAVSKVAGIGRQIVQAIANAIRGGAGTILSAAKSIIPNPKDIAGGLVHGLTSILPGHALGGIPSGTSVVGERGPELATFPAGTRITPLAPPSLAPAQLAGAGGGRGQTIVNLYLERRLIAQAVAQDTADRAAAR